MPFTEYAGLTFRAFTFSTKQQEIIDRKQDIIAAVYAHHNFSPRSVLFIGFNPAIMATKTPDIALTYASAEVQEFLQKHGIKFRYIDPDDLPRYNKAFDSVVALEEFFTFCDSEETQKRQFDMICKLASRTVITTLRDYKNQEFKDREFSLPAVIHNSTSSRIYLEYHNYDIIDRNAWNRSVYEITGTELCTWTKFQCRHMFFKQCAKFGFDAGAKDFLVHKNLMYKSLIKKNYEHVISLKFG
jgi:hypothetical protein